MRRRTVVAVFLAAVGLAVASPVAAAPPETIEIPVGGECDGVTYEGTLVLRQVTAAEGIAHFNVQGVIVGSNGVSVRVGHAWTMTASMLVGLGFNEWSKGVSVRDAGLIRFTDGFTAGPHPFLFEFGLDPEAATCYLVLNG